jgi:hypothetical protein
MRPVNRREMLVLAALLAAGCGPSAPEASTPPQQEGTGADGTAPGPTSGSPSGPAPPGVTVPAAAPWQAGDGEVLPQVKELAARLVETAGTWTAGASSAADLRTRLADAGFAAALADAAIALQADSPAASLAVIYPQYGGLSGGRASVMVTAEQTLVQGGALTRRGHTVDVRLVAGAPGGQWLVDDVLPGVPGPPGAPVNAAARAVLENARITLPAAAEADIRAGVVDHQVLAVLAGLAADHELTVTVLVSGHPRNVFGTDRVSKHTLGKAVDIWAIDGQAVVDPDTPRDLVTSVMRRAAALGAAEVGGPVDLDARGGGTFFTDQVHQDHVHVGVPGT